MQTKGHTSGMIRRSDLPTEYKTLMYIMLDHMDGRKGSMTLGLAWPSVDTLAIETGMVKAHCQAVLENLAYWDFLSVEHTPDDPIARYRFNIDRLAATQPLGALMLRNKLRRIKGLSHREHWLLEVIGKHSVIGDPEIDARVSWELVEADLPWFKKHTWRDTLESLRERGILENIGGQANQHRRWIELRIHLAADGQRPLAPPAADGQRPLAPPAADGQRPLAPPAADGQRPLAPDPAPYREHSHKEPPYLRTTPIPPQSESATQETPFWGRLLDLAETAAFYLVDISTLEIESGTDWHESYADLVLDDFDRAEADDKIRDPAAYVLSKWRGRSDRWDMSRASPDRGGRRSLKTRQNF